MSERYKMTSNERKQYFKDYYLKTKEEKKDKEVDKVDEPKKKRGRPKKVIPPFKITRLAEPIVLIW